MNTSHRLFAAVVVGLLCAGPAGAANPTPDAARASVAQWVETQQLIAKERKDWQDGKQVLEARIAAVQSEIDAARVRLAETRKTAAEAAQKKSGDVRDSEALQKTGAELGEWVAQLEQGLRTLQPRLPEPLGQKVKPLYERMPADAHATAVSLAERYQNVVGILNEVGKFNGEITMVTEVRTLSDGKPAEVRTIYVGLAQAYYVSPKGDAGIGRPGTAGWEWVAAKDAAPQIQQAVEVLQNKAKPGFIALPVRLQ